MAATTLSPARALRQPRHLDWRSIFGVFLLLVATGGSLAFWTVSSDTRAVVVATRDLPAGATLSATDLAVARVRVDDTIYHASLPADELTTIVGKQLAEPVHAHQLLVRPQLSNRPVLAPNQLALTIAISPETAVGGRLRPGDAVQVLVTTNKGKPEARSSVVLPRVTVYDVGYDQRVTVVNTDVADRPATQGPAKWLTLIVTSEQALQLAQARHSGELDVALLPPEQP
ncbi:MAG: Flp pilus assembly protein CpaB [Chloroflexi bacterium]|nr:Flp pilus assembly protein CpaB [Chloroflexota bacterium]